MLNSSGESLATGISPVSSLVQKCSKSNTTVNLKNKYIRLINKKSLSEIPNITKVIFYKNFNL